MMDPQNLPQPNSQPVVPTPINPPPMEGNLPPNSQTTSNLPVQKVPFYRMHWRFGAIYLFTPVIIGLLILLKGDIFRKQKDGQLVPIRKREKVTLTIISVIIWGVTSFLIYSVITASPMQKWVVANYSTYNANALAIKADITQLQTDSANNNSSFVIIKDCEKLISDAKTARGFPKMPDNIAVGYYEDYLTKVEEAGNKCIESFDAKTAKDLNNALVALKEAIVRANTSMLNLQSRFISDGLKIVEQ